MTRFVATSAGLGYCDSDGGIAILDLPYADLGAAFAAGASVGSLADAPVRERRAQDEVELLAPVRRPPKIWAVGFGYRDHRTEVGFVEEVSDPVIFLKASSSVVGTGADIRLPAAAPDEVDYEGELGVVVGSVLTSVTPQEARRGIAGYTICNDVSARDVQKGRVPGRKADVSAAKSFDTFTPTGPCLNTLDEFADPYDLGVRTCVDDELRQDARTRDLIHPVPELLSYLSRQTTLEPGDLVLTGTPGGVGHKQGRFLRPGATVRIAIEGIGELVNTCR